MTSVVFTFTTVGRRLGERERWTQHQMYQHQRQFLILNLEK